MNTRALLLSGLIAGVLMGLLSELPILSIANCCLCLWIWAGGIFAVFLYRRFDNSVGATTLTQGVLVGLVAGLVAAVLGTILAAIIGPMAWQSVSQLLASIQGPGWIWGPSLTCSNRGPVSLSSSYSPTWCSTRSSAWSAACWAH